MKKLNKIIIFVVATTFILLTGCQSNNNEIDALKKENEQLKQQIEEMLGDNSISDSSNKVENQINSEFNVNFKDNDKSITFGNSEHIAEIKNVSVVYSPELNKYLLKVDFHYTNKSNDSGNFINDLYCNVIAYQNGIELDTPGITSEKGVYNTNSAYTRIKNAEIDAQLAFVLNDTESSVELELGSDYYSSLIIKTVVISKK